MAEFDVCIIGAGTAGLAAAFRAVQLGAHVALVQRDALGGTGIWDGALSSKTLWHLSSDFARAQRRDRGYLGAPLTLSWPDVCRATQAACTEATGLIETQLTALSQPSTGRGTITRFFGAGLITGPQTVQVGTETVLAKRLLLATGSVPRVPAGITLDGERIVTSDSIERLTTLPRRLAIIGAGVVGCEYATIFAQFGATAVQLFDRQPRILPFEDDDIADVVATRFNDMGITVHRSATIDRVARTGDVVEIEYTGPDGTARTTVDVVLVATGRVPALANLGLAAAGVELDPRGGFANKGPQVAPTVWAAGDVTPELMLANLADIEARAAIEAMLGHAPRPVVYDAQPAIYFLSPEVGTVGHNELSAKKAGLPYRAAVVCNNLGRRNMAMRATAGLVKLLAAPDGRLLGLRVVGPQAGTCIQGVALLMGRGGTLEDLDIAVHPHPSVTESVQEAARLLLGRSFYDPATQPGCYIRQG